MAVRAGQQAFEIGEVLDQLERATREVGKSLDPLRGTVDRDRLHRARGSLEAVLRRLDALTAGPP